MDAHTCRCPYCGKPYASRDGPECDCLPGEPEEAGLEDYYEDEQERMEWRVKKSRNKSYH